MYYGVKGFVYSAYLVVLYILLVLILGSESNIIMPTVIRAIFSIAIAGTITFLSIRHKRAENELRENETLHRTLLANIPAGIIIIEPVTRMIENVNDTAAAMFGAQAEHIIGHRCHTFLCPAGEGACPVCDLGKEVDNSEREMICADTSRRPVLKSVKQVQIRGQKKLLECFVDITDRKDAEGALRISEAKFKEIFETIEDLYYETDSKGIITILSPSIHRLTGWNEEDLIGKPATDVYVNPDDREPLLLELLEKGYVHDYGLLLKEKDGKERPTSLSAHLIIDHDKRPIGVRGLLRDMTDRKRLEEVRLRHEKLESMLEIAGTICHELNQPIQIVSGYIDLLSKSTSESSPMGKKLNVMKAQIHRMSIISKKLMSLKHYTTRDYIGIGKIIDINETSEEKSNTCDMQEGGDYERQDRFDC
jgi:PAS domain S-box-containing protein